MSEHFYTNIKFVRKQRGLSQEEVADGSGVNRTILSRIENGKIETSVENAYKLSKFFNISISDLISKDLRLENVEFPSNKNIDIILDKTKDLSEEDLDTISKMIDLYSNRSNK